MTWSVWLLRTSTTSTTPYCILLCHPCYHPWVVLQQDDLLTLLVLFAKGERATRIPASGVDLSAKVGAGDIHSTQHPIIL